MAPRKPKRLRGHALALHLERSSHFVGVRKARVQQKYLSEQYKLDHQIPLNIWDAARSYRETTGDSARPLREVLKDDRFRGAWREFRGGGLTRGKPTTLDEKLQAARTIGWYKDKREAIERLRSTSP